MPVGKCKLCLQEKELRDSHLIGRAVYRLFREDEGEDPIVMTPDVVLQTSQQVSDYVFCDKCEDRFNKGGEKYVTGLVWRRSRFPLLDRIKLALHMKRERTHIVVSGERIGIDTDKVAYYALSVVWRAAVHTWKTIGQQTTSVVLGSEEENIRKYLMGQASFPDKLGVMVTVCTDRGSQMHYLSPTMLAEPNTFQQYVFLVRGVHFGVMIAMTPKAHFLEVCCVRSSGKKIFVTDMEDFTRNMVKPFHQTAKIARNVRSRLPK